MVWTYLGMSLLCVCNWLLRLAPIARLRCDEARLHPLRRKLRVASRASSLRRIALACLGTACLLLWPVRPTAALAAAEPPRAADETKPDPAATGGSQRRSILGPNGTALRATRRPTVDGRLDDEVWRRAPRQGKFVQRFPHADEAAGERTEFAIAYDDVAVYIAVWAHDTQAQHIRGLLTRRDEESPSDNLMVALDTYFDRRTAFAFGLNAAGVQRDALIFDDSDFDDTWDAVWSGAVARSSSGWTAEYRIPLSQLRFSGAPEQTWGVQVVRYVARTGEEDVWASWPRAEPRVVSRFGSISGISNIRPGRRLELLPYVTAGLFRADVSPGDPLHPSNDWRGTIGLDAKYGLSSAFTLSATVNPDFGQVQADPSQVNLTAYEQFFAERRPFFLEGTDLFSIGLGVGDDSSESLFYSRRIGGAPHGHAPGEYVDAPKATTIYGAAKVSGKTPGGWSFGWLNALTAAEYATSIDSQGLRTRSLVEPLTNYSLGRLRKDFREGRTAIGGALSAVNRKLAGTPVVEVLHRAAYSLTGDAAHRFGRNDRFRTYAKVIATYIEGAPAAVAATQRTARHNFQRPDAPHLRFDPAQTTMSGVAVAWHGAHQDPKSAWWYGTGGDVRSPGFEVNDLGYQTGADMAVLFGWVSYRNDTPGDGLNRFRLNGNWWSAHDFQPRWTGYGGNINANATTADMWNLGAGINIDRNLWDTTALRGGGALRVDTIYTGWASVTSDSRKRVVTTASANAGGTPEEASWFGNGSLSVDVQARSNITLSVGPNVSVAENARQYVAEVADGDATPHYVFARVRQTTAAMTLQANWTLSPRLGVTLYAQPFVATGAYNHYREFDRPDAQRFADRSYEFAPNELRIADGTATVLTNRNGVAGYQFAVPDFAVAELRSTVVLRWDYRPGSSLFAVWSHNRGAYGDDGTFVPGRSLQDLAAANGEDVVMAKLNYWFGL